MPVSFFFEKKGVFLPHRTELKSFIISLFRKEKKPLSSLNYVFCSDARLLQINRDYLHHDYYTDIITFDLSESEKITGEIYISIDRVRDNARKMGEPIIKELRRVMFHGALHLCGYSDITAAQKAQMRQKEDAYLSLCENQ